MLFMATRNWFLIYFYHIFAVGFFQQQEQDPTNLYIANLPTFMKEKDLEGMFSPFGTVISTRILRDNSGVSRGVGFCRMESRDKCQQIIEAFNGHMVQGNYCLAIIHSWNVLSFGQS